MCVCASIVAAAMMANVGTNIVHCYPYLPNRPGISSFADPKCHDDCSASVGLVLISPGEREREREREKTVFKDCHNGFAYPAVYPRHC